MSASPGGCCGPSCCSSGATPSSTAAALAEPVLRDAQERDLPGIVALLKDAGLPADDLRTSPVRLVVAERAGGVAGVVGLEVYGRAALLRSLAVVPECRGQGLGGRLVAHACAAATGAGVDELYLLTTTAAAFFERRGFARVDRGTAPASVRGTAEFAGICPSSAVCMRFSLASAPAAADGPDAVRETVRAGYAAIARGGACGSGGCGVGLGGPEAGALARAVGYVDDDLAGMPEGANMGLSCGNPTALATLRPGEVVLDLGSGGGFDCFIAGPKVGKTGRVIGVDMTPDMLGKARRNVASYREQTGLDNVEFRLGEIEALPVADASVDVVVSNCVLNLSPDKARVWREIARVLKPGGRVAVSDLALVQPLPDSVRTDVEALVGCVAGAALVEDTRAMATVAGLTGIVLKRKSDYLDAMTQWQDPLYQRIMSGLPTGSKPSDYITSLDVSARKPG